MTSQIDDIHGALGWLTLSVAEIERRLRNTNRVGTVEEVDAEKGLARVRLTDGDRPLITGWIPWTEQAAGDARTHHPPSKGQQVRVRSQNGELSDAEIETSVPSDANKRPSTKADETVLLERGKTRISVSDGGKTMTFTVGSSSVTITDGGIVLKAPSVRIRRG